MIKRFDREADQRIDMEDFAQILAKYPHEKYNSANYENIGKVIYDYSGDGVTHQSHANSETLPRERHKCTKYQSQKSRT